MNHLKKLTVVAILGALCCNAGATTWKADLVEGLVVHVDDGDTLSMLLKNQSRVVVRLSDIDAPELSHGNAKPGQPYAQQSRLSLKQLALGKHAKAYCFEHDIYGRSVCHIYADDKDVNALQLQRGLAWANRARSSYVRDPQSYQYEDIARRSRTGLWSDVSPIAPWNWRKSCWRKGACTNLEGYSRASH